MSKRTLESVDIAYVVVVSPNEAHKLCRGKWMSLKPFKLGKPPIVEVWVAIAVEPNPNGVSWGTVAAEEFHRKYGEEFGEIEGNYSQEVQVARRPGDRLPTVIDERADLQRVRAFNSSRTKCLQYSGDTIVFNSLQAGDEYPGFDSVYAEAAALFRKYLDYFRPLNIREASLCYIDVISIPVEQRSTICISDYFTIGKDVPEDPFGQMVQYLFEAVLHCPADKGPAEISLRSLPAAGDGFLRFYMQSQKTCVDLNSLDLSELRERLYRSKDYISDCFKNSFTEEGWQLFEPDAIDYKVS